MTTVVFTHLPKICHAPVGSLVQLPTTDREPTDADPVYLVCAFQADKHQRAARPLMTHGLYDDQRQLFLVNVATGEAIAMPHLSSRALIVRDATIHVTVERA